MSILYIALCCSAILINSNVQAFRMIRGGHTTMSLVEKQGSSHPAVPMSGIIDYIGRTATDNGLERWSTDELVFQPPKPSQIKATKFKLWRQYPWKKIKGQVILKAKISGSFPLEGAGGGGGLPFGGGKKDYEPISSIEELSTLLRYAAIDPRIQAIVVEIGSLNCGYAKLQEVRRMMSFFRQSGKKIIGYCSGGAEKELYFSLGCDEFYIPPDGGLDLRGFSGAATFVRGVFDKIGIEPQVQRIGKYKSFGDTFNRTTISEAQREVVSSLLMEASDFWADHVGIKFNKSPEEVMKLWADQGIKTPYDFKDLGYITGVKYLDQVESMVKNTYKKGKKPGFWRWLLGKSAKDSEDAIVENDARAKDWSDFTLENEFLNNPRRNSMIETKDLSNEEKKQKNNMIKKARQLKNKNQYSDGKFLAAGLYLRKMRKGDRILEGLQMREVRGGPRIVVINAVGGIGGGKSGSGVNGKSLGSDTLIEQVRQAKADSNVKAVIIRVDSPGGSALASDLMWREIRALSKEKPVIASMVDVAASGGYYIAMACDEIVAEELTITGSIGVVSSKFNAAELNEKIGFGTETISRGRYAEVLSTTRGFTQEEDDYFAESARKAYTSFITKAAASRNMSVEALNEVAQGRVWTGRQALNVGLVDHMGGINKALKIATKLADIEMKENSYYRVQTYREPKGGLPFPLSVLGGGATASSQGRDNVMAICDSSVAASGLASEESLGVSPIFGFLGIPQLFAYNLAHSSYGDAILKTLGGMSSAALSGGNGGKNGIMNMLDELF